MSVRGPLYSIYHPDIPSWLEPFLATGPMLRLKDVGMNCGMEYTRFPIHEKLRGCYSRYEHSLGTALILWHFTHDKKQTLAGLLHDISTPAFAHVIDFLHHDHLKQESTEAMTRQVIEQSEEIGALLNKEGVKVEEVCDYHQYPLADNESPRLSADRLEYTLGNAVNYQGCSLEMIRDLFEDLTVGINEMGEQELMFQHQQQAIYFTELALTNSRIYASDEDRYGMQRLADLIHEALDRKILAEQDLMRTENDVIAKLKSDVETERMWNSYCRMEKIEVSDHDPQTEGWIQIEAKKRVIDPYLKNRGRITMLDSGIQRKIQQFKDQDQSVWIREKKCKIILNRC